MSPVLAKRPLEGENHTHPSPNPTLQTTDFILKVEIKVMSVMTATMYKKYCVYKDLQIMLANKCSHARVKL